MAVVLFRYGLGNNEQVKDFSDLHGIVTRLKNLPVHIMEEDFLINKVCSLSLSQLVAFLFIMNWWFLVYATRRCSSDKWCKLSKTLVGVVINRVVCRWSNWIWMNRIWKEFTTKPSRSVASEWPKTAAGPSDADTRPYHYQWRLLFHRFTFFFFFFVAFVILLLCVAFSISFKGASPYRSMDMVTVIS